MSEVENSNNIFIFDNNPLFLCKAKERNHKFWVTGYFQPALMPLLFNKDEYAFDCCIKFQSQPLTDSAIRRCFIDETTLCRCIGAKDINDNLIFDNDYIKFYPAGKNNKETFMVGRVFFDMETLSWQRTIDYVKTRDEEYSVQKHKLSVQMGLNCCCEVIGNAFDYKSVDDIISHIN